MKNHNFIYKLALFIAILCNLNNAFGQATSAGNGNSPVGGSDYIGWTSGTNRDLNINNQDPYHIRFYTNNAERVRILGSGNTGYVGIATTSPTSVLHIDGNGAPSTTGEVFKTDGPGATLQTWKILKGGTEYGRLYLPASGSNFNIAAVQDNLNFLSGNSGTQLEAMRIVGGNGTSARFVGIGDWNTLNSAQSQLHQFISGNNNIYHQFTNDNTAHTNSSQGFKVGITYNGGAGVSHAELNQQENADMLFSTNAAERMRILSGGDVGIATASPTARLHVVGVNNSSSATYSLKSEITSSTSTANPIYSMYGNATGASRPLFGGYLVADGTTNGNSNDV
jgi:hypothetical protein